MTHKKRRVEHQEGKAVNDFLTLEEPEPRFNFDELVLDDSLPPVEVQVLSAMARSKRPLLDKLMTDLQCEV